MSILWLSIKCYENISRIVSGEGSVVVVLISEIYGYGNKLHFINDNVY